MDLKDYYTASEAAQYLAEKWGIESYSTTAFRLLRHRWGLTPDRDLGNASLWKPETLDAIPKPDRSRPRPKRKHTQQEDSKAGFSAQQ